MLDAQASPGRNTVDDVRADVAARWVALAAIAIVLTRDPAALLMPQLWAEDGPVFVGQALRSGWAGLFEPYAGYFHLLPRLVANIFASVVPLDVLPLALGLSAISLTGLAVYLVATARVPVAHRWLYGLALVLVPHDGEVFGTITNLQWFVAVVLFTLVLQTPARSWRDGLRDGAIALVCGLTGPFAILIVPLLALRYLLVVRPTRYDLPAFAILVATAAAALMMYAGSPARGDVAGYFVSPGLAVLAVLGLVLSPGLGQLISLPVNEYVNYALGLVIGVVILLEVARPAVGWFRGRGVEAWAALAIVLFALALELLTIQRVPFWNLHVVGPRALSSARNFSHRTCCCSGCSYMSCATPTAGSSGPRRWWLRLSR